MAGEVKVNDNGEPVPSDKGRCIVPKAEVLLAIVCTSSILCPTIFSIFSVVTDPPYAKNKITQRECRSMLAAWRTGISPPRSRKRKGIDGSGWDAEVLGPKVWTKVWNVFKHGGFLAIFTSEEKVDLQIISLRLAGFEIVHAFPWIKGAGQGLIADLGKSVQREAKRAANDDSPDKVVGYKVVPNTNGDRKSKAARLKGREKKTVPIIEITVPEAICWQGARQCLNHAHEFIVIASKPLKERSRAKNILKSMVRAACRSVPWAEPTKWHQLSMRAPVLSSGRQGTADDQVTQQSVYG